MRFYNLFETKEERTQWEREKKEANKDFKVCFRIPVKFLKKEVYLTDEQIQKYRYATVWMYKDE